MDEVMSEEELTEAIREAKEAKRIEAAKNAQLEPYGLKLHGHASYDDEDLFILDVEDDGLVLVEYNYTLYKVAAFKLTPVEVFSD
jgi:hypothetical protein